MRIDLFWKSWIPEYRRVWYLAIVVFILFLIFLWSYRFSGADPVTDWVKLQEQKEIETTIHNFQLGPFNLSIPAESYVILEYFHGTAIRPNTFASYCFLVGLTFGVAVLLSVITTLKKYWYLGGVVLFIIFMVSLRLQVLGIFGMYTRLLDGVAIGLFVIVSYYFNRIRTDVTFSYRLLTFLGLYLILALIITFGSHVDYPFYHLTLTAYPSGMIISILFIIIIAHEILAGLVYMVSQSHSHNLRHFSLIVLVYMGNLIITCFHELGAIQWKFLYIDLYLLLTLSSLLGIFGIRQRESQYQHILPSVPLATYGFLAMATICFATVGQLLGNWNDPALRVIRDAIIFSHTGYGIIFLVYIFSNFIYLLARNLPVHKVLYNPTRMPYFTYAFAGMIAMLAFVFYSNWRQYVYHAIGGFYNITGDLYILLGNDLYAESFYEQGAQQAFQNNRSNYALGTLKAAGLNFESAHAHYALANDIRPTPYSMANKGNLYIWEEEVGSAIDAYRKGYSRLNNSPILSNNLGFAFIKNHQLDSSLVFLNTARRSSFTKTAAETNFFALAALERIPLKADSIIEIFKTKEIPVIANALALSTIQGRPLETNVEPLASPQLNLYTATLLNNFLIKHALTLDTTFIRRAYDIASDSLNSDFSEVLKSSIAFGYYHQGNVSKALQLLAELVYVTQNYQGKFNYIMGLWALEQGNPELATSYFTFADTYEYKEARFYNAIALSEAGKTQDAIIAWDSVFVHQSGKLRAIALQMKKILSLNPVLAPALSDPEIYQYCRYRINAYDSSSLDLMLSKIQDANYKAQAMLDASRRYHEAGLPVPAVRYFRRIAGLELTDKKLYEEIRHFELLMLADQRDLKGLAEQINRNMTFDHSRKLHQQLFTALLAEASGDTTVAHKNYNILATYNPYLEEGIIAAADFFRKHDRNRLRPYNILAEAIQINTTSIPLLRAYVAEAVRMGFDEYAFDAGLRLKALEASLR